MVSSYDDYYLKQVGGQLPVFVGSRVQRGHGLGNMLSGLVRVAMPLLKKVGKQGLKTGVQVVGDILGGQKPKHAISRRGGELLQNMVLQQTRKRGASSTSNSRRRRQTTKKRRRRAVDIFD